MPLLNKYTSILTLLIFFPITSQANVPWLESIIAEKVPYAQVAVVVEDLNTHRRLIERRANEHYIPASVTKLFTSTAALLELGPDYHINTSLYFDPSKIQNHKLKGPLWLVFRGDPMLRSEDLSALFNNLKTKYGVESVDQIYVDDRYFSEDYWPFGITWNSLAWGYLAPVTSIIIDKNAVPAQISVPKKLITTDPSPEKNEHMVNDNAHQVAHLKSLSPFLKIHDNGINVVSKEMADSYCHLALIPLPHNELSARGCWSDENKELKLAITDPKKYLVDLFPSILKNTGISYAHQLAFKDLNNSKNDLTEINHESPSLSKLLHPVLFESDNVVANALTKTLAANRHQDATLQTGAQIILDILQEKLGLNWHQELILKDGAGGSYNNLITPNSVSILLRTIAQKPELNKWIFPALPKPATREIYQVPADLAQVFVAKTGTMHNDMNIAGYIMQNNSPTHSFVIFVNNASADEAPSRELQGKILQELYRQVAKDRNK